MIFQTCECGYCTDIVFPALWQLPDGRGWFEIPKNGSHTVKSNLEYTRPHSTVNDILVFVRDPVRRAWGTFGHYMIPGQGKYKKTKEWFIDRINIDIDDYNVKSKLAIWMDHWPVLDTNMKVHHLYPQTHFVDQQYQSQLRVMQLEKLTEELGVTTKNQTNFPHGWETQWFSKKQLAIVEDTYKEDYEFIEKHAEI